MGGGTAEKIARFAIRAEQTGYHTIWVSDHLLVADAGGTIPPIEIMGSDSTISHHVYIGFADKWTETGGYVEPKKSRVVFHAVTMTR